MNEPCCCALKTSGIGGQPAAANHLFDEHNLILKYLALMDFIAHEFHFNVDAEKVREALSSGEHIKNWWTSESSLEPKVGAVGTFKWNGHGWIVKTKLEKIEGNSLVQWKCIQSNMQDTSAWVGTIINFKIFPESHGCRLEFSHEGYRESHCKEICTAGWKYVLGSSLKAYLETGKGTPYNQ